MTTRKTTKRALLLSGLSLLLCISMLIGSTFAWFTDTASTGVNKIQAGNLDMELAYKTAKAGTSYAPVDSDTPIFTSNLWEPGHVEAVNLKVSNAGTLAFKYQLGINIANEVTSINVEDVPFKLSDYIRFAVIDGAHTYADSAAAIAAADAATNNLISTGYTKEDSLAAGADSYKEVTLIVYMPTTVGNDANYKKDAAQPYIDLGITAVATQLSSESDSFGTNYDQPAPMPNLPRSSMLL